MLAEKNEMESHQEGMGSRAYELAKAAHRGKNDRGGHPYIGHPVRVSARFETDTALAVAALLHDTVEDTPVTLETIEEAFGTEIRDLVEGLTHRKESESYSEYVARAGSCWKTRWIKMADLLDNMDVSRLETVTEGDKKRLARYADALATLLGLCEEEGNLPPFKEEVRSALAAYHNEVFEVRVKDNFPHK